MYINEEEIVNHISAKPFHLISEAAEELGVEVYVIGGYVRDIFLNRPSKDCLLYTSPSPRDCS